jgi:hypothetical protein
MPLLYKEGSHSGCLFTTKGFPLQLLIVHIERGLSYSLYPTSDGSDHIESLLAPVDL